MKRSAQKAIVLGAASAIGLFILFGMITAIIINPLFVRMMPVQWYDYAFLSLTAALSGAYVAVAYYVKKEQKACGYIASGGTILGVFSFGCAVCNKLLITLLGVTGVITYYTPIQPALGVLSIALLVYALRKKWQTRPGSNRTKRTNTD